MHVRRNSFDAIILHDISVACDPRTRETPESVDTNRLREYLHLYARHSAASFRFRAHIQTSRRSICRILFALFPKAIIPLPRR